MAVDVIIDPLTGQIYWNDSQGTAQSIAISGNGSDLIKTVGYSLQFSAAPAGTITSGSATTAVTGSGTNFLTLFGSGAAGSGAILYTLQGTSIGTVSTVASDTSLTLSSNASGSYTSINFRYSPPSGTDRVIFSDSATPLYPATTGANLGTSANRWALYASTIDASSNLTFTSTSLTASSLTTLDFGSTVTSTSTLNIGTGVVTSATKTINIGTGGTTTATTTITLGTTAGTSTIALNGTVTLSSALAVGSGGTGTSTAPTQWGIIFATSTSQFASTGASAAAGSLLHANSGAAPTLTTTLAGQYTMSPSAGTGTQNPVLTITSPAHTALTASAEHTSLNFNLSSTIQFATGAITTLRAFRLQAPTYSFQGASTVTNAAALQIDSAPVAGTNATLTETAALRVLTGTTVGKGVVVRGAASQTGNLFEAQNSTPTTIWNISAAGNQTISPAASTGTQSPELTITGPAHTALTASTEFNDINFNFARTVQFATGAITTLRAFRVQAPTYGFQGASTVTNTATLQIDSAPVAGTNATLTETAALRVLTGTSAGKGLVVRGSASQSVDLVDIQNSSGASLFEVTSTGVVNLGPIGASAGNTNELRFLELAASGVNFSAFKSADAMANDIQYTLPSATPTTNQVLTASVVSGTTVTLSWVNSSGSGTVSSGTATQVAYYSGATTTASAAAMVYNAGASNSHLVITAQATTNTLLRLTGIASQSVDLFQVATSGGNVFTVGSAGISTFANSTAATTTTSGALIITGGIGVGSTSYLSDLFTVGTTLSATSATTINLGTSAATKTINIGTGGTSSHTTTITIGTTAGTSTLTIESPTVATNTTSLTLFNANATTVNAFGAATALTLGATSGTSTIRNATIDFPNATTISGSTGLATVFSSANPASLGVFGAATTATIFGSAATLTIGATSGTASIRNATITLTNATSITGTSAAITMFGESTTFTLMGTTAASTTNIATGNNGANAKAVNIATGGTGAGASNVNVGVATGTFTVNSATSNIGTTAVSGVVAILSSSFTANNATTFSATSATSLSLGASTGTATIGNTTFTLTNATSITGTSAAIAMFGESTTFTLMATTATSTTNIATGNNGTNAKTLNLATGGAGAGASNVNVGVSTGTFTVNSATSNIGTTAVSGTVAVLSSSFTANNATAFSATSATTLSLGASTGTATIGNTTFTLTNATSITGTSAAITMFGESTSFTLLGTTATSTINIATGNNGTNAKTLNLATGGTGAGNSNINIGVSTGTTSVKSSTFDLANATSITGSASLTTVFATANPASLALFGAATTVTIFGAATTLSLGSTSGTVTIANSTATFSGTTANFSANTAFNLGTSVTSASTISIGTGAVAGAIKAINIGTGGSGTGTSTIIIGTTSGTSTITLNGVTTLSSALAVGSGGTGTSTAPTQWGVIFATSTSAYNSTAAGTNNQWLSAVSSGAPTWSTATLATTYSQYDLVYASASNGLSGLANLNTSVLVSQTAGPAWLQGATGNRLLKTSGSVISWGQVDLASGDVTGTLAIGSGGTGTSTAPTQWGVMFATSASAIRSTAAGTNNQWLAAVTGGAPVWSTATLATTFSSGQFLYASSANAVTGLATTTLSVDTTNIRIGIGTSAASSPLHILNNGTGTNAVVVMKTIDIQSTGTPANGFGGSILFDLESTTTAAQDAASIETVWSAATHATRLAELNFKTNDVNTSTLAERMSISNITTAQSSTNATVVITGTLGVNSTSYLSSLSLNTALAIASGGTNTSSFATTNGLVYFNGTNLLTTNAAASGVLVTNGSNVPSIGTDIPTAVTIGGGYIYRASGTDVPLADGGTNASLTGVAGGVVYSTASAMAITTAGSSGQPLLSGGSGAPSFGTLGMGAGGTGLTTTTPGANFVLGMNASNNGLEYKQLVQGSNITITHAANSVTITASGGSATPGGSNTQIQFNSAGALGGISNFTYVSPLLSVTNATNFGTTSTAGLELKYNTAAGTTTVNNNSPAMDFIGRIYASAADRNARIRQEIQTTAATPSHAMVWSSSYDTGTASYTRVLSLHSVDGLGFWNYAGTPGSAANYFKTGNQASDIRYTWPTAVPTANQVLSATGVSGSDITLGWATAGGGSGTVGSGTANQLAYYSGATTTASDASLVRAATGTHLTITAQGATTSPLKVVGAASQSAALFTVATSGADVLVVGSAGAITTGTWNASTIGVLYGGTGQTTYTDGQLLIGNSTGNTLTKATLTAGSGVAVTNGSGSITVRQKRPLTLTFCSGYTPAATGADSVVLRIPDSPADGTTSLTYNLRELFLRVETPSAGTSTVQVEYYTGTSAFSATNLLSSALSATGAAAYEFTSSGFSTSTLASGTKLRLNFTAINATHANFFIQLLLEEN